MPAQPVEDPTPHPWVGGNGIANIAASPMFKLLLVIVVGHYIYTVFLKR